MDAFFRAVAIGLGVLMGTFNQGVEPELVVRVHKDQGAIYASGTLQRAVSPKMEEALEAGVPMALTVQGFNDGRAIPESVQVLTYLPLTRQWQMTRTGDPVRLFAARAEAEKAWVTLDDLALGPASNGPFQLSIRVELSFPGRPEWKADMVWTPGVVTWEKSFGRLSEIPF